MPNANSLSPFNSDSGRKHLKKYEEFGLKKHSSAGSIIDRIKKQILKDKEIRNKLEGIKKIISKS